MAGDVADYETGSLNKRSGRRVQGVRIKYEQSRKGYQRKGFTAECGQTKYKVKPASVKGTSQTFRKLLEVPPSAQNVHFYQKSGKLSAKYQSALQNVK